MKRILITGSDGSLGSVLMRMARFAGYEAVGIPKLDMNLMTFGVMLGEIEACDFIINNHGFNRLSRLGSTNEHKQMYEIIDANVMAPYHIVNEAVQRNWGPARVLNIGSITHRIPQRMTALYCASKAALVQMTRVMARELAPSGWVVNCLCPGKIEDTEMSRLTDEQVEDLRPGGPAYAGSWKDYALSQIPMGRFTTCYEVGEAVFAILAMPSYLNGAIIDFTGGM